jgi:8-oxo-dGTP diphosphatase
MSNAYEEGTQKVIPAVLLYAFHENKVLMLHGRGKDGLPGKWNGLGGKLEAGEAMLDACVREFSEEASCLTDRSQWRWLGQLYFPNFKSHKKEDWWVNVFVTDLSSKQKEEIPLEDPTQPEGALHFLPFSSVFELDLWEGDTKFLPYVFARTPFEGTFFYENGHCTRFELKKISSPPTGCSS